MRYQRPKGTADILPGESAQWEAVEKLAREIFARYGYREIRTPIFENYNIFARSAGETSDVVTKEMYDFKDKGDRHVALRPEGTAGVVRAYVENKLYGPEYNKPYKVYYMGPMFRYERPQSGRQREFHQIGVEAFGSDNPAVDVEVMTMALRLFKQLGLTGLRVAINTLGDQETRDTYRQALIDYLKPHYDELSEDSQERLEKNPLRVLDSKDPRDKQFVDDAPSILDYLTDDAQKHFDLVKEMLDELDIDRTGIDVVRATVEDPGCYRNGTIPGAYKAMNAVSKRAQEATDELRRQAQERLADSKASYEQTYKVDELPEHVREEFETIFQNAGSELSELKAPHSIRSFVDMFTDREAGRLIALLNPPAPEPQAKPDEPKGSSGEDIPPEVVVPPSPVARTVSVKKLTTAGFGKPVIESAQDADEYLAALKAAILDALGKGEKVTV